MKALIALGNEEGFEQSLAMLIALCPTELQVRAIHVSDCSQAYPGYGVFPSTDIPGQLVEILERNGKCLAQWASEHAAGKGIQAAVEVKWGSVGQVILHTAAESLADVVAVHRRHRTGLERLFLDSVSKAVVLGAKQSVLVTKGGAPISQEFTAVLGVDHSQYSQKCVELLLRLRLTGLKRLVVVTAVEGSADVDLKNHLMRSNEEICGKFSAQGIEAMYEIADGRANQVLREAMKSSAADLMIVGAQGHGFVERLLIGSTSLHQVAVESYPVLVLRV